MGKGNFLQGKVWIVNLNESSVARLKKRQLGGIDDAYNEFVNLLLITHKDDKAFAWANQLIDKAAQEVYQPILEADFKKANKGSPPAGLAREMVEEAMSEIAGNIASNIIAKNAPHLAYVAHTLKNYHYFRAHFLQIPWFFGSGNPVLAM